MPTTASAAAHYWRESITLGDLLKVLQDLPPEARRLPVIYRVDGWRHTINHVKVVQMLGGRQEIELSE